MKTIKGLIMLVCVTLGLASVAQAQNDLTFKVNGVSFTMKYVQGGTFPMGSNDDVPSCEASPLHSVTVNGFYMCETEVTQALWRAVMGTDPSYFKDDNRPVETVSWNDCYNFVRELNRMTGRNFRLPTEAEWEYAARGGNRSSGASHAGSFSFDKVAWCSDNSGGLTHPVKTKQANELGLYDMSGNVAEWCSDWYGDYSAYSQLNPQGPSNGEYRVYRGGCWSEFEIFSTVSCRNADRPDTWMNYIGFRFCLPQ